VRAVHVEVGAPPERELLLRLHLPHLHQRFGDVDELDAAQHALRLLELRGVELAVDSDPRALDALLLDALEQEAEEVDLLAHLHLALVREGALAVLHVEVHAAAAEPPRGHDVAVEAGVEEPGVGVVLVHEHGLRPLGVRVPVAGEVHDVHLVADQEGLDLLLLQQVLEARDGRLVPLERKAVGFRGVRRPFLAGSRSEQQLGRGAGLGLLREQAAQRRRLRRRHPVDSREERAPEHSETRRLDELTATHHG
jgi:hypothetical protein